MKSEFITALVSLSLFLSTATADTPWNPYGVAGYISRANLDRLGFPAKMDTYDWNNLRTDIRYQMVRPFHYWYRYYIPGGNYITAWATYEAHLKPKGWFTQTDYPTDDPLNVRRGLNMVLQRPWGYHLDRTDGNVIGQIGLPPEMIPQWYLDEGGNHQTRFQNWVLANPGKIWLLGNEPKCNPTYTGLGGQDALTDREYTVFFHTYRETIRTLDPTSRFANAGEAMTTKPTWREDFTVENVIAMWERVLGIYATEYEEEMPVDVWNMHLYSGHACDYPNLYRQKFATDISLFSQFTKNTRGGIYRDCPVILTEFGGNYDTSGFTREETVKFIRDFRKDLHRLWIQGVLDQWFWFVSSGGDTWPFWSIIEGSNLTIVGEEYRDSAWMWEDLKPPIFELYGTRYEPFDSDWYGLWTRYLLTSGGTQNSIHVETTNSEFATMDIHPGNPTEWEVTLMVEDHLAGFETFSFLEGQGVGLQLGFSAGNSTENSLYLGYLHGNESPQDGEAAVLLRAEQGLAANTTILDASTGAVLLGSVNFAEKQRVYFVVNDASGIDFHLNGDYVATLARRGISPTDTNQLRLGSNSRDASGNERFRGEVRVYGYALDDDILASPLTIERMRPYLQLY